MKKILFSAFVLLSFSSQSFSQHHGRGIINEAVHYHGRHHGVPYGYGYFPIVRWPAWYWWNPYMGFSFFSFFNYYPRYATFGAISYSVKTGRAGYAWGQSTLYDAASYSKSHCAAEDCRPVVWVQGGCAAVTKNDKQEALGWGYGVNRDLAQFYAMESCKKSSSEGECKIQAEVCSF